MFWNKYPYTDFSQINLDWVLMKIKELGASIKGIKDNISSYVSEKVEEMISSGEFDDVVKVYFEDAVKRYSTLGDIQSARQFRTIDSVGYQDLTTNGSNFIFVGTKPDNSAIRITETDSTGSIIRYNEITSVTNCNSIAYDASNNRLYVTSPQGAPPYNGFISVVDYATFSITDTIRNSDYNLLSSCVYNGAIYAVGYYIPMGQWRIVKIENGAFTPVVDIYLPESAPFNIAWQSVEIVENICYITFTIPNSIMVVDMESGKSNFYSLPNGTGFYPYGELEGITKRGDSLYISSVYGDGQNTFINQVFETNILGNMVANSNVTGRYPYISERSSMYVDSTSTAHNPTGYSDARFKCMTEATAQWEYLAGQYFADIYCANTGDYSTEHITFKNCHISLNGNGSTFGELVLQNCTGQIYNFATVGRCALLNYTGRVGNFTQGSELQLVGANVTMNTITPTVNASSSTVVEGTPVTYGTVSNLIKLAVQS